MSDSLNYENFTTTAIVEKIIPECKVHSSTSTYKIYVSDNFECFVFQLPYILYDIKFGYFVAALTLPIILISIFGSIKLQYRWFILNLSLIDLFNSLDFICTMPSLYSPALESGFYKCAKYEFLPFYSWYFVEVIIHLPPIGVFLLAFSRFISVYFPHFCKKVAKTWIIFLFITMVDSIYIAIIFVLNKNRIAVNQAIYDENKFFDDKDNENEREKFLEKAAHIKFLLLTIYCLIPAIILLISIIFFVLLVVKIIRQLKFQAKSNSEMFRTNLRIIAVLSFQTFTLCILFPIEAMYQMNQTVSPEFQPYYPFLDLRPWIYGLISENGVRCFREFRVFIDSLIILIFMKGYRNDLCKAVLWIFVDIKNLWNYLKLKLWKTSVQPF